MRKVRRPMPCATRVLELHRQVVELLPDREQEREAPGAEVDQAPLSFRLTGPLPLELDFKQSLLPLRSETQRLERVAQYFERLLSSTAPDRLGAHEVWGQRPLQIAAWHSFRNLWKRRRCPAVIMKFLYGNRAAGGFCLFAHVGSFRKGTAS